MLKILGALDMAVAFLFFLMGLKIVLPKPIILIFAIYLICKALLFITDLMSAFDLVIGGTMLLFYFTLIPLTGTIPFIFAVFLAQKAFFSLI